MSALTVCLYLGDNLEERNELVRGVIKAGFPLRKDANISSLSVIDRDTLRIDCGFSLTGENSCVLYSSSYESTRKFPFVLTLADVRSLLVQYEDWKKDPTSCPARDSPKIISWMAHNTMPFEEAVARRKNAGIVKEAVAELDKEIPVHHIEPYTVQEGSIADIVRKETEKQAIKVKTTLRHIEAAKGRTK